MRRLVFLAALCLLPALPAAAQWTNQAWYALPYIFHEQEIKQDLEALNAALQKIYLGRIEDRYVAELVKRHILIEEGNLENLVLVEDFSRHGRKTWIEPGFQTVLIEVRSTLGSIQSGYLTRVNDAREGLAVQLEKEERQAFQAGISSQDMVELKEAYLRQPKFFTLPLTYANARRFSGNIVADPKQDLAKRWALAEQLAEKFRLQKTDYHLGEEDFGDIRQETVQQNLAAYLSNEFSIAEMTRMLELAETGAGTAYLSLKDHVFRRRFTALSDIYRREYAATAETIGRTVGERNFVRVPVVYPVKKPGKMGR